MAKLKILYIITKGNWGGAQKYVFDMATHMPKDTTEVKVVCGAGDILPKKLSEKNILVISLANLGRDISIFKDLSVFFDLITLFKHERPDVVHLNSSKIGGLGAIAARIAGIKKIFFTVHGFAFNENRPWWQKKIITFLSWLTIVFCTDVIFISHTEYSQAKKWPGIQKKAHLIYNGIKSPVFLDRVPAQKALSVAIIKDVSFFANKTIVGTIAELTPNKGLSYALEAFSNLPDNVIYIIIGRGELETELSKIVAQKNLSEKVFFAGFMEHAAQYLKAFDIFLLPSLKEGMPYVLIEAGFAEVPIIATNVGAIAEIIEEKTGIMIEPKDSGAIAAAITTIHSDKDRYSSSAHLLKKIVEEKFNLGITVDKTLGTYLSHTI